MLSNNSWNISHALELKASHQWHDGTCQSRVWNEVCASCYHHNLLYFFGLHSVSWYLFQNYQTHELQTWRPLHQNCGRGTERVLLLFIFIWPSWIYRPVSSNRSSYCFWMFSPTVLGFINFKHCTHRHNHGGGQESPLSIFGQPSYSSRSLT